MPQENCQRLVFTGRSTAATKMLRNVILSMDLYVEIDWIANVKIAGMFI